MKSAWFIREDILQEVIDMTHSNTCTMRYYNVKCFVIQLPRISTMTELPSNREKAKSTHGK